MANKYLEKMAGLGAPLKAFAGHATGKTLHGAEMKEAVRKGLIESGAKNDSGVAVSHKLQESGKGSLFDSSKHLKAKKIGAQGMVAGGAVGAAHASFKAGQEKQAENKYLDKAAGVMGAVKDFVGHASGKTLAETGARHAIENAKHVRNPAMRSLGLDDLAGKKALQSAEIMKLKGKKLDARVNIGVGAYAAGASGLIAAHVHNKNKVKK